MSSRTNAYFLRHPERTLTLRVIPNGCEGSPCVGLRRAEWWGAGAFFRSVKACIFRADKTKTGIVNVDTLSELFVEGEKVTLEELKKRFPYLSKKVTYIKVLARGRLDKPLIVEADEFSLEAVKMIVLEGGKVIRTLKKPN